MIESPAQHVPNTSVQGPPNPHPGGAPQPPRQLALRGDETHDVLH